MAGCLTIVSCGVYKLNPGDTVDFPRLFYPPLLRAETKCDLSSRFELN